ncbi:hypothetical protein [Paraliobacillus salinarum]|uniref:hypothetical protein n=1 Tax=Paraliobacillus salinarum TaxID=1158996 RepID=UPI0015F4CA15|nr:hypothetical protein [Paraliobacillus salinarum]
MNKVDENLAEVVRYQREIKKLTEEDKVDKIYLLSKQLIFIGRLSAIYAEHYKQLYVYRKQLYNEEYLKAKKHKAATAEIAVVEVRKQEAEAYGNYKRWNVAFITTREEINALKYKVRIDLADGSSSNTF